MCVDIPHRLDERELRKVVFVKLVPPVVLGNHACLFGLLLDADHARLTGLLTGNEGRREEPGYRR